MAPGFWKAVLVTICALGSKNIMADSDDMALKAVAKSNTEFTSSLYNVLAKNNDGNLIFSPFSLSTVMAMLKAGSRGKTASDIQSSMKFPESDDTLNQGYNALLQQLKSDKESFTLETVNKIYTQNGFNLKPEFTSTLKKYFGAEVTQVNFAESAKSAKLINDFVANTTRDKIKDLISPSDLDAMTRLVLVNAIYFKGMWKNKFDPTITREADFYLTAKNKVKVQMMRMEADLPYAEIEALDAKAVALPYKGDRLSMIILLPNQIEGLKDMETRLQNFSLATIPTMLRERKVNLALPKFTLESTIDLKDPLSALGAGLIFDQSNADFSGISADPKDQLYVSKAVQKAFIEVNEEGSEAAAATGFQISVKSAMGGGPRIQVNHPFLAMILDDLTGAILFEMTFTDPDPKKSQTRVNSMSSTQTGDKTGIGSISVPSASLILPSLILMPLLSFLMRSWVH